MVRHGFGLVPPYRAMLTHDWGGEVAPMALLSADSLYQPANVV